MAELPSLSLRKYIRRGNGPAEEPTSTLVLTSGAKHFVDVRVLKPQGAAPMSQVEWAFAGTSTTTPAEYEAGRLKKPVRTVWSHWIDSETTGEVNDEGDIFPQPDGTVLEKGTDDDGGTYEELWGDFEPQVTGKDKARVSYVLRLDDPTAEARGVAIRIGEWIQGILRQGDQMTIVRWHWVAEGPLPRGGWKRLLAIGTGRIPLASLFDGFNDQGQLGMEVGSTVATEDGMRWTCVEAFLW